MIAGYPATGGITLAGLRWAFASTLFANWLPVTSLSHMLDYQLYGAHSGGHHATSAKLVASFARK